MWTLAVYLALKDVWNADLLLTHWYISQPLLVKLFTVHVSSGRLWKGVQYHDVHECSNIGPRQ